MKTLAILTVLLLSVQSPLPPEGGKTCSGKTQSDFPAPAPANCGPGTTMNPGCLANCKADYSREMLEIAESHCNALHELSDNFLEEYQSCLMDFSNELIYCTNTYHDYPHLLNSCMEAASEAFETCAAQARANYNHAIDTEHDAYLNSIGAVGIIYMFCTMGCCE